MNFEFQISNFESKSNVAMLASRSVRSGLTTSVQLGASVSDILNSDNQNLIKIQNSKLKIVNSGGIN